MTGHLLGAAGSIEAVISVKAIETGIVPPTINYETPDPDCDLDYTPNVKREAKIDTVLTDNLGFGGHNAALVFRRGFEAGGARRCSRLHDPARLHPLRCDFAPGLRLRAKTRGRFRSSHPRNRLGRPPAACRALPDRAGLHLRAGRGRIQFQPARAERRCARPVAAQAGSVAAGEPRSLRAGRLGVAPES